MIAYNCTERDLETALEWTNRIFEDNVAWHEPGLEETDDGGIRFRLRVLDTQGPGTRFAVARTQAGPRRRLHFACWHVHGHFFESLFRRRPKAEVRSKLSDMDRYDGNWTDRHVVGADGEQVWFSRLCDCSGAMLQPCGVEVYRPRLSRQAARRARAVDGRGSLLD